MKTVTPLICIFAKTFVVNFDPFLLFIDLANFNFTQLVVLSRFIFILGFTGNSSTWSINLAPPLDPSCMITEYQMFIDW